MDIASIGMASVACITVICYLAALAIKQTPLANKWLPTICGVLGALLGLWVSVPVLCAETLDSDVVSISSESELIRAPTSAASAACPLWVSVLSTVGISSANFSSNSASVPV